MVVITVDCPVQGCTYKAENADASIVGALLIAHSTTHAAAPRAAAHPAKADKLKRPSIGLSGTTEAWSYFLTRWAEYRDGTNTEGDDIVVQLLECCSDELRHDFTRAAGKSLIGTNEVDILE